MSSEFHATCKKLTVSVNISQLYALSVLHSLPVIKELPCAGNHADNLQSKLQETDRRPYTQRRTDLLPDLPPAFQLPKLTVGPSSCR